jgi:hypothetical protein
MASRAMSSGLYSRSRPLESLISDYTDDLQLTQRATRRTSHAHQVRWTQGRMVIVKRQDQAHCITLPIYVHVACRHITFAGGVHQVHFPCRARSFARQRANAISFPNRHLGLCCFVFYLHCVCSIASRLENRLPTKRPNPEVERRRR